MREIWLDWVGCEEVFFFFLFSFRATTGEDVCIYVFREF